MLSDYYSETKYIVDTLAFQYRGGYYKGHGILTWKPEIGFRIESFLQRTGEPIPEKWGIGGVGIIPRTDYRAIRMTLRYNGIAIAPCVPITDQHDLFSEKHLDLLVGRVIFLNQAKNLTNVSSG